MNIPQENDYRNPTLAEAMKNLGKELTLEAKIIKILFLLLRGSLSLLLSVFFLRKIIRKSVLAAALAYNEKIRQTFFEGNPESSSSRFHFREENILLLLSYFLLPATEGNDNTSDSTWPPNLPEIDHKGAIIQKGMDHKGSSENGENQVDKIREILKDNF